MPALSIERMTALPGARAGLNALAAIVSIAVSLMVPREWSIHNFPAGILLGVGVLGILLALVNKPTPAPRTDQWKPFLNRRVLGLTTFEWLLLTTIGYPIVGYLTWIVFFHEFLDPNYGSNHLVGWAVASVPSVILLLVARGTQPAHATSYSALHSFSLTSSFILTTLCYVTLAWGCTHQDRVFAEMCG
jgi:hypothetical protein